jgi:hypothetical protein
MKQIEYLIVERHEMVRDLAVTLKKYGRMGWILCLSGHSNCFCGPDICGPLVFYRPLDKEVEET